MLKRILAKLIPVKKQPYIPTLFVTPPKRRVSKVFIHCSASDNPKHDNIATIRKWHKDRNMKEVGYHFFIRKTGMLELGRSLESIPAAQKNHNTGSIAICVHGLSNFTKESLDTLVTLCKDINLAYGGNITFHGHREVANKTCPVFDYKALLQLDEKGKLGLPT